MLLIFSRKVFKNKEILVDITRPDEELISQNPRDALILRINTLLKEQKVQKAIRVSDWEKQKMKRVYERAFQEKVFQLFRLNGDLIKKLSEQELNDLADLIYERAKRYLWLKKTWRISLFSVIPIFGWFTLLCLFSKDINAFPDYKISSLREWYKNEFGVAFPIYEKREDDNGR